MNDYWNDPPEQDECPECCDEYMHYDDVSNTLTCVLCGKVVKINQDSGPEPDNFNEDLGDVIKAEQVCPHGKKGECGACDHLSDIAYDSAREMRAFGR